MLRLRRKTVRINGIICANFLFSFYEGRENKNRGKRKGWGKRRMAFGCEDHGD
jgi:hypothetical protein